MAAKMGKEEQKRLLKSITRILKLQKVESPVTVDFGHPGSRKLKWVCRTVNGKRVCRLEEADD